MMNIIKSFIKEEKGQTVVEWIMILALILIAAIVAVRALGQKAATTTNKINTNMK